MPTPRQLFNRSAQKSRRQDLRANLTEPEKRLWQAIRGKQLGAKFRRQHGIGPYIADFYCPECNLVIELDGDSHFDAKAMVYDQVRDSFMRSSGVQVLRFTNIQVMQELDAMLEVVRRALKTQECLHAG